ncbi:MAG TPA: primosomal protein N' [Clostridiaceae bacterium]
MYKYAKVIINSETSVLDKPFTYSIPTELSEAILLGHRVYIPFGLGNKKIQGFIFDFTDVVDEKINYKAILSICDELPLLTKKDIILVKEMRRRYLCSYIDGIKAIIPTGITRGVKRKINECLIVKNPLSGKFINEKYETIMNLIKNCNGAYTKAELVNNNNISRSSIETLIKHDFLELTKVMEDRFDKRIYPNFSSFKLNEEQQIAYDKIMNSNKTKFLIYGVTGSGKTEVYMKILNYYININKEIIILVPEISLTPQMVERFKGRFGNDIAVFHSRLSEGERFDEWLRIKEKRVKIAIGARSAVFLPFENLGAIIIDEEHETSYKSENDPKYNAKEIAEIRCELTGAKLVLGTATPSVDTYYKALSGEIELINIRNRVNNIKMPTIEVVDMREELANNNRSVISDNLKCSILKALENKEQVILFLNRRGHSTFVSCRKCGYVFKCDACDVSLTYHKEENNLACHYCGNKFKIQDTCPKCGSKYVKYFGIGTEKLEHEIKMIFPLAKVIRMDLDTTREKNSHEKIYNEFKNHEADILIGTQMIAKGLDFPNVTLVGVIAADLTLNLPDFRASERNFQLLTQVTGRSGRGLKEGKVIIQTYNPEHYSITDINKFEDFYSKEIEIRKALDYPPFTDVLYIQFIGVNEKEITRAANLAAIKIKDLLINTEIQLFGPTPCEMYKIKEMYRYKIFIRGIIQYELSANIKKAIYAIIKKEFNNIRISIDRNPINII